LPSELEKYSGFAFDEFSEIVVTQIPVLATLQISVVWLASSKKLSKNLDKIYHSNLSLGAFEVCLIFGVKLFIVGLSESKARGKQFEVQALNKLFPKANCCAFSLKVWLGC